MSRLVAATHDELVAEIDRLRAERDDWKNTLDDVRKMRDIKDCEREAELDRLRATLKNRAVLLEDAYSQRDRLRHDIIAAFAHIEQMWEIDSKHLAEIDRLRAEKAEANNQWRLDYNVCAAELDRLRAENSALRQQLMNSRSGTMNDSFGASHDSSNNTDSPPGSLALGDHLTD